MVQKIKKRDVSEYPAWLYYICWVLVLLFGLFVFLMWVQGTALFPMFLMMGMPWWMSLPLLLVAAAYPLSEYVGNLADNVTTTRWSDGAKIVEIQDKIKSIYSNKKSPCITA